MDLRRRATDIPVIRREAPANNRPANDVIDNTATLSSTEDKHMPSNWRQDWPNITLLYALYVLQGIPLGLIAAVPMLLQNHGASYKQQAEFSFANWPFSLKLLWAPIVDSLYMRRFGLRKSWLVPSQYLLGCFMIFLSHHIDGWLDGVGEMVNLPLLTMLFFILNFLAATQDIAVDGWALTMLKPWNVGYASTANSVGQTTGYFLGYVLFMALESAEFCNRYLRAVPVDNGMITLSSFLFFWGVVFLVLTTLVALFKREDHSRRRSQERPLNIFSSYRVLLDMLSLRPIRILTAILLSVKVIFAASDNVSSLKLIEAGVPKEKLALLAIPIVPVQILLPIYLSRQTNGPRPLDLYVKSIPPRIFLSCLAAIIVYVTPTIIRGTNDVTIPVWYYVLLVVNYGVYQVFVYGMFVAVMAFFAKISDPMVGGTYMTFLNTLSNLGGNWPGTVLLWLVEVLTWSKCVNKQTEDYMEKYTCNDHQSQQSCQAHNGECKIYVNGFYLESLLCAFYGVLWLLFFRKRLNYLQELPISAWRIPRRKANEYLNADPESDNEDDKSSANISAREAKQHHTKTNVAMITSVIKKITKQKL